MGKEHCYLAIDIGGSKLASGLVTREGTTMYVTKYLWECYNKDFVISKICTTVDQLLQGTGDRWIVDAIGVTIPGFADPENGIWLSASFMGIYQVPIAEILRERFRLPVYIEKDTNACCLAEKVFGGCQAVDDFLYLTVSNGIGGAFFLRGSLYYGAYGYAGEYGMCVVKENGAVLERKKLQGSLESHASGRGLIRSYLEAGGSRQRDSLNGEVLAELAERGDCAAVEAFRMEGYYLGKVIAAACNLLDPRKVVIGGGLSLAFPYYRESLEQTMQKQHYMLEEYTKLVTVEPTCLGYHGGLIGAATVASLGLLPEGSKKLGYRG